MTPDALTALAEACERAAGMMHDEATDLLRRAGRELLSGRKALAETYTARAQPFADDHAALIALAAALRAGRVTITEEAP